jgi:hypothetical protein
MSSSASDYHILQTFLWQSGMLKEEDETANVQNQKIDYRCSLKQTTPVLYRVAA